MKVLVIYTHPSPESYNHALLESFLKGLKEAGHDHELVDLYKENFNPVLTSASSRAPLDAEVEVYQKKITQAECLAFIFPTFWYRGPAMLEGFIDRVFTPRFAYKYVPLIGSFQRPKGLLTEKKAVVIQTFGGPWWYYRLIFRTPWIRFRKVIEFFGIKKIIYQPCYSAPFTTDKVRQRYIEKVRGIGKKLK